MVTTKDSALNRIICSGSFLDGYSRSVSCYGHPDSPQSLKEKPAPPPTLEQLQAHWSYMGIEGPDHWVLLLQGYLTCAKGSQQFPINIHLPHHCEYEPRHSAPNDRR